MNDTTKEKSPRLINFDNPDIDAGMNTAAAAKFLGYSVRYLEKLRQKGGGPKYIPNPVRYTKRSLIEWMDSKKVHSTSEAG